VRVLLLNLYYPPDTSATAKMAQTVVNALAEKHDVTVLCGRPSYDPAEHRPWRLYQSENSGRARIIRAGSTDFPRLQMKKRLLNYLSYVFLAVPRALFLPCDVILAMTDPPFEGIVGAFIALLKRKPYVYNIRDLYPDMALGGSIVSPGLLARLWEKLHRWALRRATRVVVLGDDMRNRILAKGVDPARVVVFAMARSFPLKDPVRPSIRKSSRRFAAIPNLFSCMPAISVSMALGTRCSPPHGNSRKTASPLFSSVMACSASACSPPPPDFPMSASSRSSPAAKFLPSLPPPTPTSLP